ncbi:hypothetical protein B1M_00550 [Burkholderia sp. TJI49]|nr:hypothetical protein B1M_00550 [Burkholderia sp. TJI49]
MNEALIQKIAHWLAYACFIGGNLLTMAIVVIIPALLLWAASEFAWKRMKNAHDLVQLHWMIQEMHRQGRLWNKGKSHAE